LAFIAAKIFSFIFLRACLLIKISEFSETTGIKINRLKVFVVLLYPIYYFCIPMSLNKFKPIPVRLNELTPTLRTWANEEDRSAQYMIRKIIEEAIIKKFGYKPDYFKKMRAQQKAS